MDIILAANPAKKKQELTLAMNDEKRYVKGIIPSIESVGATVFAPRNFKISAQTLGIYV